MKQTLVFILNLFSKLLVMLSIIITSGCDYLYQVEDVSAQERFKDIVGAEYVLIKNVNMVGVTLSRTRDKSLDYITLKAGTGFHGREVVFKKVLVKGSIIKVESARVVGFSMREKVLEYVVLLNDSPQKFGVEVILRMVGDNQGDGVNLNTAYFQEKGSVTK